MSYKLGITILHVRDLPTATKFYSGLLGLPIIAEQTSPTFATLQTNSNTLLGLQDVSTEPNQQTAKPGAVELGFEVSDVNATWRDWKSKGVHTLTEPADFPFGRAFDAQDPEGHPLTIYQLPTR